ncbi:chromosome segregation protein SMC [Liquorilactobacillus oeni]|uniref:Chromosome partition protein Smc n=1 Tax=Liquorilactobacillus oeni DSM 19972 TaxID=1423777 RepID=A0A0R1MHI6_9LACO|nr:chromosome segregation protein SMC [Liquorilactobacillus oeni]KRL04690.1 chromosome partition protein [Liquorilactobacillus oeni DSM 19972]
MKLKSLVINGFKSFADKTQIDFQAGMTAVVGPNGSGKSNIIEAIRWVLGEQSAKSLRSGKMPDVIFAGSSERKALNRAAVEITFSNLDRYLPINEDEVVITRRIYRNGDSEFLLNGKNVRLKDITDLMLDTGLGKESFSIISQGRVESIFNSKAEDRRTILEEVAGVLKYKKEKQKAQQELSQTAQHLNRVADIVSELSKQREPLKEQSSLARDYMVQKKELDHYNLARLVLEIIRDEKKEKVCRADLAKFNKLIEKKRMALDENKQQSAYLQQQQHDLNEHLDELQEQSSELAGQHERLSGQKELSQKESEFQKLRQQELETKCRENRAKIQQISVQREQLLKKIKDLSLESTDWQKKIEQLEHLRQLDEASLEERLEELRNQIIANMQKLTTLNNQASYHEKEKKRQEAVKNSFAKKIGEIKESIAELQSEKTVLKEKLVVQVQKTKQLEKKSKEAKQKIVQKDEQFAKQKQRWYKGLEILQRAQVQYDSLKNISENYSGYFRGVKEILQSRSKLEGIIGAVTELLEVPPKLALAVEMSLGGQLQNVVVANEAAAKEAINFLTGNHLGRVTFLPRTSVRQRRLNAYQQRIVKETDGVLGVGNELVSCEKEDQAVLNYLLGATVFVTDLEVAIKLASKIEHTVRIVTLDGDVINPGGSITGGSTKQHGTGLLEQKQKLQQLKIDIVKMKDKMQQFEIAGTSSQKEIEKDKNDFICQEDLYKQNQQKVQEIKNSLVLLENKLKYQLQQADLQHFEFENTKKAAGVSEKNNSQLADEREKITAKLDNLHQKYAQQKEELANLTQIQQKNLQQLNQLKQQTAVDNERVIAFKTRQEELKKQEEQYQREIKKAQADLQLFMQRQEFGFQKKSTLVQRLVELEDKKKKLIQKINEGKEKRDDLHNQLAAAQKKTLRLNELQEITFNQQKGQSVTLSRLDANLDRNLQELAQEYQISFESAKEQIKETNLDEVLHRIKLLKLGIGDLGNVNLGAIEEYEQVNSRYQFLETQQTDLIEAKKQLQNSMLEMDNEVKVRFKKTFKEVAFAFSTLFPKIFGGGRAALKLTRPDDLLTSGIDIMAQPPGKKLQQLSLLSGGEKALTAIALLFAILKVKPVPFVILDEAEAALDDANVERYASYLQNFHDQTQFITITHRKGTMKHADILYGITMQESGISRMVSVSLANAK